MENDIIRAIKSRRSHRAYHAEQISGEQIDTLMNAALASPSANNLQPWHFSFVQDQDLLDQIHQEAAMAALNKTEGSPSTRFLDTNFHVFYHAPTVVFISSPKGQPFTELDCGIAAQNIVLAAESMGLGSVILGLPRGAFSGPAKAGFETALRFPKGYVFTIAVAVGIPADDKPAHDIHPEKVTMIG